MKIPQVLRKQVIEYAKAGFHVVEVEPRSGSHFLLKFSELKQAQIVTKNACDPRSIKNNISAYRRLLREQEDADKNCVST